MIYLQGGHIAAAHTRGQSSCVRCGFVEFAQSIGINAKNTSWVGSRSACFSRFSGEALTERDRLPCGIELCSGRAFEDGFAVEVTVKLFFLEADAS